MFNSLYFYKDDNDTLYIYANSLSVKFYPVSTACCTAENIVLNKCLQHRVTLWWCRFRQFLNKHITKNFKLPKYEKIVQTF